MCNWPLCLTKVRVAPSLRPGRPCTRFTGSAPPTALGTPGCVGVPIVDDDLVPGFRLPMAAPGLSEKGHVNVLLRYRYHRTATVGGRCPGSRRTCARDAGGTGPSRASQRRSLEGRPLLVAARSHGDRPGWSSDRCRREPPAAAPAAGPRAGDARLSDTRVALFGAHPVRQHLVLPVAAGGALVARREPPSLLLDDAGGHGGAGANRGTPPVPPSLPAWGRLIAAVWPALG